MGHARALWPRLRVAAGGALVALTVWWLGLDPVLAAFARLDTWTFVVALAIAVPTTVCCAWRWTLVSRSLGSPLSLREAVPAYYRSQFLNTVLPGGVLGDVHRAALRGRDVGRFGHAARVVLWERTAGQVVQLALTAVVLLVLPSPIRSSMPVVVGAALAAGLAVVLLLRSTNRRRASADIRACLRRRTCAAVVLTSAVVVAGHTATFLVAARVAGVTVPLGELLPLALLVLLATAVPTNLAGWGPREGAAAWLFGLAGLGAAQGLTVAVMYGVMALVATLPGAAVLMLTWRGPRRPAPVAVREGVARG